MSAPAASNECITVVVRCRPMSRTENEAKRFSIVDVDQEAHQVAIKNPAAMEEAPKGFTFDATYDDKSLQRVFYEESCFSIVESCLEGFNSTIFAYGQTGCGKSFTMQGPSTTDPEMMGVIPNSFSHIFQFVKSTKDIEFLIRCSYLELYNEEIRDLLSNVKNPPKCELKEDNVKGIYVKGLSDVVVESAEDLSKMLDKGLINRTTASTLMNSESSRSHSIFTIIVEMSTKDQTTGKEMLRVGKLNLVDLAGSERAKKTGAQDKTLKEGIKINLSLSALGNVISALSEGTNGRHIPYRDSKLTRLLQDSLGGNAKTMMIAAISPADYNYEETLSTLRYANRAKNIKNKPKINEDPKDTMIREFKAEIERLKQLLMDRGPSNMNNNGTNNANSLLAQLSTKSTMAPPRHSPRHTAAAVEEDNYETDNNGRNSDFYEEKTQDKPKQQHAKKTPQKQAVEDGNVDTSSPRGVLSEQYTETFTSEGYSQSEFESYSPVKAIDADNTVENNEENYEEENDNHRVAEIRDEIENRIHQLEHMLVNNHDDDTAAPSSNNNDNTTIKQQKSEKKAANMETEPTAEELESQRLYKERKLKAKQKREEKQKKELQKVLDEKRLMEEELEELRAAQTRPQSHITTNKQDQQQQEMYTTAEVQQMIEKKMNKLKKKYEKKEKVLTEQLQDLKDDYFYQQRQNAEAAKEQSKDAVLYELICRSVLTEKDLRKILDKCRYDEENDEWIVPFTAKKKQIDLHNHSNPSTGLFPEINHPNTSNSRADSRSGGNRLVPIAPMGAGGSIDYSAAAAASKNPRNNKPTTKNNSKKSTIGSSVVPLLTLPGSLVSASSIMGGAVADGDIYDDDEPTGGAEYGMYGVPSNRSDLAEQDMMSMVVNMTNMQQQQQPPPSYRQEHLPGLGNNSGLANSYDSNNGDAGGGKKKKSKIPKVPAINGATNNSNAMSAIVNNKHSDNMKMPSIHGAAGAPPSSSAYAAAAAAAAAANNGNSYGDMEQQQDEAGNGETAGPLDDWGWANEQKQGKVIMADDDAGADYSEDEDFVTSSNHGNNNKPPSSQQQRRKKKKKANRSARNSDDGYGNGGASGSGGGYASSSLPPIDVKHSITPRGHQTFSLPPI